MNVSVIGTGYVGLVTGACLAEVGHQVVCMDDNPAKVEVLLQGRLPIYEPYLDLLVARNRQHGRLRFTTDADEAVREAAVIFICVNTPPRPDGEADLTYVELATRRIAEHATRDVLITEKSTVPVQTGQWIEKTLAVYAKRPGITFDVASNPEFTREGMAVEDFLHPDRIVVGVSRPRAEAILRELYAPILEGRFACPIHSDCRVDRAVPFLVTDIASAELIKHAANSFLATEDLVRQCRGGRLRVGGCGHSPGGQGSRAGQADRTGVLERRDRVRRLLFPQGPPGLRQDRGEEWL